MLKWKREIITTDFYKRIVYTCETEMVSFCIKDLALYANTRFIWQGQTITHCKHYAEKWYQELLDGKDN